MKNVDHSAQPEAVRQALRRWTSGVCIVTCGQAGNQQGMTVSSFTSVALEPPVVLVALNQAARTHALVRQTGVFGVTILAADQRALSERFAGLTDEEDDRFAGLETFILTTGSPFIHGSLAYLDCEVVEALEVGANTLFLGVVVAVQAAASGEPLVYHDRAYREC